eukprot:scaffold12829_cov116-Isochrysis_galbana.AAC.6
MAYANWLHCTARARARRSSRRPGVQRLDSACLPRLRPAGRSNRTSRPQSVSRSSVVGSQASRCPSPPPPAETAHAVRATRARRAGAVGGVGAQRETSRTLQPLRQQLECGAVDAHNQPAI